MLAWILLIFILLTLFKSLDNRILDISILKEFKNVTVALDRDATSKAFDINQKLCYYVRSQVKILEEDLKYYDTEAIKKILN